MQRNFLHPNVYQDGARFSFETPTPPAGWHDSGQGDRYAFGALGPRELSLNASVSMTYAFVAAAGSDQVDSARDLADLAAALLSSW